MEVNQDELDDFECCNICCCEGPIDISEIQETQAMVGSNNPTSVSTCKTGKLTKRFFLMLHMGND